MYQNRNKRTEKKEHPKEDYAIILDVVLSNPNSFNDDEVAQAIGVNTYTLLELVPKSDALIKAGDKVYLGEGKRDEIQYIRKTLPVEKLSGSAKSELLDTIITIIKEKEDLFVKFFNTAGPISIRKHSLELIPRIGKKYLAELLNERMRTPFENFKDITKRCSFLHEPEKAIAQRILDEIEGNDDFKFFTRK